MERTLIFGATSAIAAEAATLYHARGATLLLVGRDRAKLAAVERRCPGALAEIADLDRLDENEALVQRCVERLGGLDTVLIAHGALYDQRATEQRWAEAERTLRTNLLSPISLLVPLANLLEQARAGRLGVLTSVAGERGRPRNYTYGTAKGALHVYLQGLRSRLHPAGVRVTTLKLGPVDTPMTKDHPKNALFGQPVPVARDIVAAMDAGAAEAFVPAVWGAIMPLVRHTPEALFQRLPFLSGR